LGRKTGVVTPSGMAGNYNFNQQLNRISELVM